MTLLATPPTSTATLNAIPIYCMYGSHKAFVEILLRDDDKVLVRATELGRNTLNKFWTAWLRDLVLSKIDAKHVVAVEMRHGDVIVSWSKSPSGLVAAVLSIAAEIRPMMHRPLKPYIARFKPSHRREWRIILPDAVTLDAPAIAASIKLPRGAQVRYIDITSEDHKWADAYSYIVLDRDPQCIMSARDLALIIEYHFATACRV